MARKRRKRRVTKPPLSHINERRKSVMKLPIIEHILADERKVSSLARMMESFRLRFQETDHDLGFKVVGQ